jgi:hypothetical protein
MGEQTIAPDLFPVDTPVKAGISGTDAARLLFQVARVDSRAKSMTPHGYLRDNPAKPDSTR